MANQYFSCVLDIWVDGATIHARMHYWRSGTYYYQDTSFPNPTMSIAGQNFEDSGFGNWVRSGINVGDVYTTEFTKTVSSNGTYGVSFSAGSGYRADFEGTWSGTATVSSIVVAPNTPTLSGTNQSSYVNKVTWGTSSFGNPSSGTVYLYGGTSNNPTTQIATKTSTGNSTFTHSGLKPNTTYYYRARAYNGRAWSNYSSVITVKTKPAALVPYPNNPEQSNVTKYVKKLEVPHNGLARGVVKLYRSVGGVAQRIY